MTEFRMVNGINADQLFEAIDPVKFNPDLALYKFRAQNIWISDTHSWALVKDFYGALQEMAQKYSPVFNTVTKAKPVSMRLGI